MDARKHPPSASDSKTRGSVMAPPECAQSSQEAGVSSSEEEVVASCVGLQRRAFIVDMLSRILRSASTAQLNS